MAQRRKTSSRRSRPAAPPARPRTSFDLPAWDRSSNRLHVLIDTPRGSRNKFKYDEEKRCFTIAHVLSPGSAFPFDFGWVPSTLADDGDPLDVLVLLDAPAFSGCLVPVRLIGALEAEQSEKGKTNRNDRLLGVAEESRAYGGIRTLGGAPDHLLEEIEHFFVSYNQERGRVFRVLRRSGPKRAKKIVAAGERRFRRENRGAGSS
jgi:inorganic pyrophosphatase